MQDLYLQLYHDARAVYSQSSMSSRRNPSCKDFGEVVGRGAYSYIYIYIVLSTWGLGLGAEYIV